MTVSMRAGYAGEVARVNGARVFVLLLAGVGSACGGGSALVEPTPASPPPTVFETHQSAHF